MHFTILKINAICHRDAQFNDFAYKKSMEYIDTINPITAQVSYRGIPNFLNCRSFKGSIDTKTVHSFVGTWKFNSSIPHL